MEQFLTIKTVVKQSESPFILTLNDRFQLIGDKARALEGYIQKGMDIAVTGYTRGDDFLIERMTFNELQKGVQINSCA